MKRYYRIKKFESDLPEVFPDYIVILNIHIKKHVHTPYLKVWELPQV